MRPPRRRPWAGQLEQFLRETRQARTGHHLRRTGSYDLRADRSSLCGDSARATCRVANHAGVIRLTPRGHASAKGATKYETTRSARVSGRDHKPWGGAKRNRRWRTEMESQPGKEPVGK